MGDERNQQSSSVEEEEPVYLREGDGNWTTAVRRGYRKGRSRWTQAGLFPGFQDLLLVSGTEEQE